MIPVLPNCLQSATGRCLSAMAMNQASRIVRCFVPTPSRKTHLSRLPWVKFEGNLDGGAGIPGKTPSLPESSAPSQSGPAFPWSRCGPGTRFLSPVYVLFLPSPRGTLTVSGTPCCREWGRVKSAPVPGSALVTTGVLSSRDRRPAPIPRRPWPTGAGARAGVIAHLEHQELHGVRRRRRRACRSI